MIFKKYWNRCFYAINNLIASQYRQFIKPITINSFDIDGVIYINESIGGVYPGPNDVIITGRSFEEESETLKMLRNRGIYNVVYFNQLPYDKKTRRTSGYHKAQTLQLLEKLGHKISVHFEDDEVQIEIINKLCPNIQVVHLVHNLSNKENVRHLIK